MKNPPKRAKTEDIRNDTPLEDNLLKARVKDIPGNAAIEIYKHFMKFEFCTCKIMFLDLSFMY